MGLSTHHESERDRARELFVTLVHGTWPRGGLRDVFPTLSHGRWPRDPKRLWFTDSSDFRDRLAGALGKYGFSTQISSFLWSGANSVRERDNAARELVEHIRATQLEHIDSVHVIVAHSHGGNVALRALDRLDATSGKVFLVTLATPFVEILRNHSIEEAVRAKLALVFLLFVIGTTPFILLHE